MEEDKQLNTFNIRQLKSCNSISNNGTQSFHVRSHHLITQTPLNRLSNHQLTPFLSTGVTGYTGGDALYSLYNKHPDWEYTAFVRDSDRAAPVAAAFPKVRFAYGTLEDAAIIEEEASKADIVLRELNL